MASGLTTTQAVEEVASTYVAKQYPTFHCSDMSVLKLGETWLVQAQLASRSPNEPAERLVLLVNRYGWVEEAGGPANRQSASRSFAAMRANALAEAN